MALITAPPLIWETQISRGSLGQDSISTYQNTIEGILAQSTGVDRERSDPNLTADEGRRLSLRLATGDDEPLLFASYGNIQTDKMALVDWPAEQQRRFLHI